MRRIILFLLFVWLIPRYGFAGIEHHEKSIYGPFSTSSTYFVQDDKFMNPAFNWADITNSSVQNSVSLEIVENSLITTAINYTVYVDIQYYTSPTSGPITITRPLTVIYNLPVANQNVSCKMKDTYTFADIPNFTGAYLVTVTFHSDAGVPPATGILKLSTHMVIDRKYTFQQHNPISSTIAAANHNQMQLSWPPIIGAEEYDLEWTTINNGNAGFADVNYEQQNGGSLNTDPDTFEGELAQIFTNNASRVTTAANGYTLSNISTDTYLLVRMRQAQFTPDGVRMLGDWDYKQAGGSYAIFTVNWNETNLNWQYSAAYAEEGKKKEVISYFDGTLRGRQTLTINNTDNVAVAQENVYDQFGRATASILPAPVYDASNSPYLRYIPNFNLNSSGNPYTSADVNASVGNICNLTPGPLSTNAGASRYYSSNNGFLGSNTPYNNFIPDAGGFPLSITQYTPDNTGRVKQQGGVGPTFQPGTNGKTTQYFYGVPAQWELDQLFGNDVGYAEHYLKNMVIDPNGQTSVSYLNASGKTIATALVGTPVAGMDPLPSYTALNPNNPPAQIHVLNPGQFIFNSSALTLKATTTYLAPVTGLATLEFDIQQLIAQTGSNSLFSICSNCYYRMTMTVTDDCNNPVYPAVPATTIIGSAISNCSASGTYTISPTITFTHPGEYFITVQLTFDPNVIQNFTDNYMTQGLLNGSIQQRFNYIKAKYLDNLDVSSCYSDCRTCSTLLGGQTDFVQMLKDEFLNLNVDAASVQSSLFDSWAKGLYSTLKTKCNTLQTSCTFTPCSDAQSLMLADVTPGGQYALFDANGNPTDDVNVIIGANPASPNWRTVFPVKPSTDPLYQSELITLDDGVTTTSPYDASFTIQQLIEYFKPSWANFFLPYHPEYCQYEYCVNVLSNYESWDEQVQKTINLVSDVPYIPGATTGLTYSHTNSADWLLSIDPLFNGSGPGATYFTQMQQDLLHYTTNVLNVPNTASGGTSPLPEKNLIQFVDYHLYCENGATATNDTWTNCSPTCRAPDREWQAYRDYYFQLKAKYYALLNNDNSAHCATPACPVGQPYTVDLPGTCPVQADFAIKAYTPVAACAGQQTAVVNYNPGQVNQPLTVNIYYPASVGSTSGLTTSVTFNTGDSQQTFCVPAGIDLSLLKVQSVNCTTTYASSSSIFVSVNNNLTPGSKNFLCQDGTTTATATIHSTAFNLIDANNNPVTSTSDVLVNIEYKQQNCDGSYSIIPKTVTIAHNTSQTIEGNTPALCSECGSFAYKTYIGIVNVSGGGALIAAGSLITGPDDDDVQPPYPVAPFSTTPAPAAPPANCSATLAIKIPRFPSVAYTQPTITNSQAASLQTANTASVNAQLSSACATNVDAVMASLAPGLTAITASPTMQANLRAALLEVCQAGASTSFPSGQSTLATPSANGYTGFGDALTKVVLQPSSIGSFTSTLNPYLTVTAPPYSPKQQTTPQVISNTSTSLCSLLTTLNTQATTAGQSLYQYLVTTYGSAMTISQADLTSLQNSCSGSCPVLQSDITLPVFLDPDATGCVLPATYTQAKTSLLTAFGNNLPVSDPNYQTILTNYLNQLWGFDLVFDDYQAYETLLTTNPTAMLCNKFTSASSGDPYACVKGAMSIAVSNGSKDYETYLAGLRAAFRSNYISTCAAAQANVNLTVGQPIFHYTLYYYDQADNLIRTIPPEGVKLITDPNQLAQVQQFRTNGGPDCSAYNGPTTLASASTALTQLSAALSSTSGGAIEFWLYNQGGQSNQLIAMTPDNHYLFQVFTSGNRMGIDIYPLTYNPAQPGGIAFNAGSMHYTIDITAAQANPWMHLVLQSPGSMIQANMSVYVDGQPATIISNRAMAGGSWSMTAGGSNFTFSQQNLSTLKHLRFYTRPLTTTEIADNAGNSCFIIADASAQAVNYSGSTQLWYRFNIPVAGGPTTVNNTTNEAEFNGIYPAHGLATTYVYNATNQVTQQHSPDGGTNKFWYDILSRLTVSQNDKQAAGNNFSYTNYDVLGRITEVGQENTTATLPYTTLTNTSINFPDYVDNVTALPAFLTSGSNSQITHTYYDIPAPSTTGNGIATFTEQDNLRKRVTASTYTDVAGNAVQSATYYNYDIDGNVKTLWQQISGLGTKRIDYEYDLISGKVNFVRYQDGNPDQFYYKYSYDAENRLTQAWTGTRAMVDAYTGSYLLGGKQDAQYYYYLHGPLRRVELGDVYGLGKVQGIDYAYTLQGWLKGVNSTNLQTATDMGQDGTAAVSGGTAASTIAQDAYGYALHYYGTNDYRPISGTNPFADASGASGFSPLYNGNIAASSVNLTIPNSGMAGQPLLYVYGYDQLNRLTRQNAFNGLNTSSNTWSPIAISDYHEDVSYDGNGNIVNYNRNGSSSNNSLSMDQLTYAYNYSNGQLLNNKLRYINDGVSNSHYTGDLQSQNGIPGQTQSLDNYQYDQIGNLIADGQAGISNIDWSVYGKIQNIYKSEGNIGYTYNAAGQRISKTAGGLTTWYVRDGQGNPLAIYDNANSTTNWREQDLYGSSRLGTWTPGDWGITGTKTYELTNHLGNVLATITDRRIQVSDGNGNVAYYAADIASANDYYPGGMQMPGRTYTANTTSYRYGFNGQEKSLEIDPNGNHNTAQFGEYDTRLVKRWNLDPLPNAGVSSYSVFGNNPILKSDVALDTPSVHEAAQMSADSYNTYANRDKIDGGWARVKEARGVQFYDEKTNFRSALYSRTIGGKTEYTYATAGTVNLTDWGNNLDQPLGVSGAYDFSRRQAQNVVKYFPGQEVTFTGHSLGGGEASLNALSTNKYAITFNAAGLGAATKLRYNLMFHKENILAFIVPGEAVSTYQSSVFLKAAGKHVYVDAGSGEVSPFRASLISLLPLAPSARIKLHLMPAVFDALETSGYGSPYPTPNDPNQIHSWGDFMRSINRLVHWGD